MIIYLIENKINNLKYIGQTTSTIKRRWAEHCRSKCCRRLYHAIKKYGKENFTIREIASADSIEQLNLLEENLIKQYNTLSPKGYNLLPGGYNKKHSLETRKRMSKTRTGKKVPLLSKPRGPMSEETKQNISKAKKGKSNGLLGKKKPYIPHPLRRKKVIGIDTKNKKTLLFYSVNEAVEYFGKKGQHSNLIANIKGRRKHWKNMQWKYL